MKKTVKIEYVQKTEKDFEEKIYALFKLIFDDIERNLMREKSLKRFKHNHANTRQFVN